MATKLAATLLVLDNIGHYNLDKADAIGSMGGKKGLAAMTDLLKNPIFNDETQAREWLEARVWPMALSVRIVAIPLRQVTKLEGKAPRLASTSATSAASNLP